MFRKNKKLHSPLSSSERLPNWKEFPIHYRMDGVTTLPVGADGAGEGTAVLTPAATTPCRADEKAWRSEPDIPRAARPVDRGILACCPPPINGTHTPGRKHCVGKGGGVGGLSG